MTCLLNPCFLSGGVCDMSVNSVFLLSGGVCDMSVNFVSSFRWCM